MKLGMPYALNEIGGRQNQEDSIFPPKGDANESTRLFLVCDGMGGHENGEVASGLVCSTFGANLANIDHEGFTVDMFNYTLNAAYDALDREDPNPESMRKMGTTLTFLHLNSREAVVAHMGDSRVYHIRPSERNPILYQSSDHSLVNELVRAEIITPEEALTHPRRNVITRAMQPHLETRYKADVRTFNDVLAGDYFFLCSDGVLESISNEALVEILRRDVTDAEKIEAIRTLCAASSKDNFSAYLVPVVDGYPAVVPDVVSAELVEDIEPELVENRREEGHTIPSFNAPKMEEERDSRRTRFTPLNIGLAAVALLAICAAIWFAVSSFDFDVEVKQYRGPVPPRQAMHDTEVCPPANPSERIDAVLITDDSTKMEQTDTLQVDAPKAVGPSEEGSDTATPVVRTEPSDDTLTSGLGSK